MLRDPREERAEARLVEAVGMGAVPEFLEVERGQHLLELALHRDGEHRLVEVDRLAQEREAAAGDDGARGAKVLDEPRLPEGAVGDAPVDDVLGQVPPSP
jgi:hypothetical protein